MYELLCNGHWFNLQLAVADRNQNLLANNKGGTFFTAGGMVVVRALHLPVAHFLSI